MKNKTIVSLGVLMSLSSASTYAALSSSALLAFDAGISTCSSSGVSCSFQGSYFSVDTDGSDDFSSYESIAISPGTDGGLLIGQAQLAGNSHTGSPDGTEVAPFDAPWSFGANTGMHQSTSPVNILSDDGSGNVTLDFSGWGVLWNGLPNIDLGGDTVNFAAETGVATLTCAFDCSYGDTFILDYAAHVPLDDPNNFGGVYWGLHLEGTVSAVPVPAALWLFGSGLLVLASTSRRRKVVI